MLALQSWLLSVRGPGSLSLAADFSLLGWVVSGLLLWCFSLLNAMLGVWWMVVLPILKHAVPRNENTPVRTPSGIDLMCAPQPCMPVPQQCSLVVTWLLALVSRCRNLRKPAPSPRLGHVLMSITSLCMVRSSLLLIRVSLVAGMLLCLLEVRVRVRDCSWMTSLSAFCLREVNVSIALIRPGTSLQWWPSLMLIRC